MELHNLNCSNCSTVAHQAAPVAKWVRNEVCMSAEAASVLKSPSLYNLKGGLFIKYLRIRVFCRLCVCNMLISKRVTKRYPLR